MNRLSTTERAAIVRALVEGNSIRATCPITGAAKGTVLRLLVDIGTACADYLDAVLRDLPCKRIQCDEMWGFIYAKEKNVPDKLRTYPLGPGDIWTWTALCEDTKLIPCWLVGKRDARFANAFMADLASRLSGRIQLTTDGHRVYIDAVGMAFDGKVDYAMLIKNYATLREGEARYSPAVFSSTQREHVFGDPDPAHVSTSLVERQNLTMRMSMRRFTRLTNGFSKKLDNLEAAVALNFAYYNFCRKHGSLGTTPAVAAGVCRYPLTIDDLVGLLEAEADGEREHAEAQSA